MRASVIPARESDERAAVRLALTRHQRRREQGIPTLGVLVGTPAAAEADWRDWARTTGRNAGVRDWGDGVENEPTEAVLYVCRSSVGNEGQKQTTFSLAQTVERLCRVLEAAGASQERCLLALAVEPAEVAAFLRDEPFSRMRVLFAEGMVTLPSVAPPAPALSKWPVRPETAASFDAATAALRAREAEPAGVEADDRARSAAERFLFDLLSDLPETVGLFELNVRLGFCFGPMPAEVDLLAAGLRLAVEIDGFHHFRDPDSYRRDRRKDALLQRQGLLVLRFLAEDVVVRLEEILEEIRTAVAFRRATRS